MNDSSSYTPPSVWSWKKEGGGRFANINRPIAGSTHEKDLPVGRHPMQLYSLATPERRQGHGDAGGTAGAGPCRCGVRRLADPDQRGRPVRQRLRCGQPELEDPGAPGPQRADAGARVRVGRDPAVPGREVRGLPSVAHATSAPSACRGCSGRWAARPTSAAASGTSTRTRPPRSSTRSIGTRWRSSASSTCSTGALAESPYLAGDDYTVADMSVWPWYGTLAKGQLYQAGEFLQVQEYTNVVRWTDQIAKRPAVRRGRMVNRTWGEPIQSAARAP